MLNSTYEAVKGSEDEQKRRLNGNGNTKKIIYTCMCVEKWNCFQQLKMWNPKAFIMAWTTFYKRCLHFIQTLTLVFSPLKWEYIYGGNNALISCRMSSTTIQHQPPSIKCRQKRNEILISFNTWRKMVGDGWGVYIV